VKVEAEDAALFTDAYKEDGGDLLDLLFPRRVSAYDKGRGHLLELKDPELTWLIRVRFQRKMVPVLSWLIFIV